MFIKTMALTHEIKLKCKYKENKQINIFIKSSKSKQIPYLELLVRFRRF